MDIQNPIAGCNRHNNQSPWAYVVYQYVFSVLGERVRHFLPRSLFTKAGFPAHGRCLHRGHLRSGKKSQTLDAKHTLILLTRKRTETEPIHMLC